MKTNPFISKTFIQKWLKHFDTENSVINPNAIDGPIFINKKGGVFYNSGGNFTLQCYYRIKPIPDETLKQKVLIINNVPDYFNVPGRPEEFTSKVKIVREYIGYLIDLKAYSSVEDYIITRFDSKKRSQFRSNIKKLEKLHNITYKMYHGDIDKAHYDFLLKSLHKMLAMNMNEKKRKNTRLIPEVFNFLNDVTYPMIINKEACMFVIYDADQPIGISLNFNSETILFGDTTGFDRSYSKYSVGIIMIIKQIEWCILNDFTTYDFSKGTLPYKKKWCNETYHFEHHIIYDPKDIKSTLIATVITNLLRLKQYLREHPIRSFLMTKLG